LAAIALLLWTTYAASSSSGLAQTVSAEGARTFSAVDHAAKLATTVTLAPSAISSNFGQAVALTATVSPLAATGRVTFYDSTTLLGTQTLASGKATLTTGLLPSGVRSLRAYYEGDSVYGPGTSAELMFAVYALPANGFQAPMTLYAPPPVPDFGALLGDFNGDGITDLLASGSDSPSGLGGNFIASVFLGNGDGTFGPPVRSNLGPLGGGIAVVGDFNGDGRADIVILSGEGYGVALGNGDGTFQPPLNFITITNPNAETHTPVTADFDGDGNADLAIPRPFLMTSAWWWCT